MKKRALYGFGLFALTILVTLIVWQGSFNFGSYGPANPTQTLLFWAVSTLVALLTVVVGFMLFRTGVKLYIERQSNREGSRIRSKLMIGALALSFVPVISLVLFGYGIMNRNLAAWFSRPAGGNPSESCATQAPPLRSEFETRVLSEARWLAALPQSYAALQAPESQRDFFARKCADHALTRIVLRPGDGSEIDLCPPAKG